MGAGTGDSHLDGCGLQLTGHTGGRRIGVGVGVGVGKGRTPNAGTPKYECRFSNVERPATRHLPLFM